MQNSEQKGRADKSALQSIQALLYGRLCRKRAEICRTFCGMPYRYSQSERDSNRRSALGPSTRVEYGWSVQIATQQLCSSTHWPARAACCRSARPGLRYLRDFFKQLRMNCIEMLLWGFLMGMPTWLSEDSFSWCLRPAQVWSVKLFVSGIDWTVPL